MFAELGAKPYHFYWVKALLKFQEAIVQSNSPLLAEVAKADARLACDTLADGRRCSMCWSAELAQALESIGAAAGRGEEGSGWAAQVTQALPFASRDVVLGAALAAYDRLA